MTSTLELAARIEARGTEIAARAVAAMYEDPFWTDRFGERGRRFADEDGVFHVTYLVESLRLGSAEPLARYAEWLRSVLVTRGMCTRHLSEQLGRMAGVLRDLGIEGAAPAMAYIDAARAALRYTNGAAARVQEQEERLAERAAASLANRNPSWAATSDSFATVAADDLRPLLSYLADALHFRRAELFIDHVQWAEGFLVRQGRPAGYLDASIGALDREIEELDANVRTEAARLLARARLANGATAR